MKMKLEKRVRLLLLSLSSFASLTSSSSSVSHLVEAPLSVLSSMPSHPLRETQRLLVFGFFRRPFLPSPHSKSASLPFLSSQTVTKVTGGDRAAVLLQICFSASSSDSQEQDYKRIEERKKVRWHLAHFPSDRFSLSFPTVIILAIRT
jgi:hypothetical protein